MTEARDGYATVDGLRLHYRVWGDESAPKLVLLHGAGGNTYVWDEFAVAMSDRYQVYALDARGHGESDHAADYSSAAMAADAAGWAAQLGIERLAVVGHSLGSGTGRVLASRWPRLVERFVNVDLGVLRDDTSDVALRRVLELIKLAATAVFASLEEALALMEASEFFRSASPVILRRRVQHMLTQRDDGNWVFKFDANGLLSQARPSDEENLAIWKAIACPVLVVRGARSDILTAESAARMIEALPGSRLVEVPDAGHGVQQENPAGFLAAVRPFLIA